MSSSPSEDRAGGSAWPRWLTALQAIGPGSSHEAVVQAAAACLEAPEHLLARQANLVATLWRHLPGLLWLGIYHVAAEGRELVLTTAVGGPNYARVAWGEGLVGTSARDASVEIAGDLRQVQPHVAAERAAKAEAAFPIRTAGRVVGVLNAVAPDSALLGLPQLETLNACADLLARFWPQI